MASRRGCSYGFSQRSRRYISREFETETVELTARSDSASPDRSGSTPVSNALVSAWMRAHLRVVTLPYPDRATLVVVEHAVLERLDPPLNLMGMGPSAVRKELFRLRGALGTPAP